jgi:hypothetical protein
VPRPIYIICSQTGALDQYTNGISIFNVIESIKGSEIKPPSEGGVVFIKPLSMRIVAAWLREEADGPEQEFEAHLDVHAPNSNDLIAHVQFPLFKFTASVHRLVVPELAFAPTTDLGPGLLRFECKIRRVGETEWLSCQEYVVLVEIVNELGTDAKPSQPSPPQANGATD